MICPDPSCLSVWLRRTSPISRLSDESWAMRVACGGCGSEFSVMVTRTGKGMTDREANDQARAMRNGEAIPGNKSMIENGGK